MINYIEFEGKSVDKALKKASDTLNKPIEKLKYDVVSYGSSGIFGLVGAKKAKIRVRAQRQDQIQKEARQQARDLVKDAFKLEEEKAEEVSRPKQESEKLVAEIDMQATISKGEEVLTHLINHISDGCSIRSEQKEGRIVFTIDGGNSALIIGKRGQTLDALQYLVDKIVNKQNEQRVRILVDVEGYLETRKANLKKLASRMADKAQRINKPVTIGQMNAYDRRIVHLHLKDNQAVRTQSMGEGYYRKLVIFPKKRRKASRQAN
jgi:spoIIIJ-associated protein